MLSGTTDSDVHLFVADVIRSFDTDDWVYSGKGFELSWVCQTGSVMPILSTMLLLGYDLSWHLALGSFGLGRGIPQGCPLKHDVHRSLVLALVQVPCCSGGG